MKVRVGFVSNSSSSSFILTTSLENWEKVKQEFHPYEVAVAESIMKGINNFCGLQVVSFATWRSNSGSWTEGVEVAMESSWVEYVEKEYGEDGPHCAWGKIKYRLMQDKELVHIRTIGD